MSLLSASSGIFSPSYESRFTSILIVIDGPIFQNIHSDIAKVYNSVFIDLGPWNHWIRLKDFSINSYIDKTHPFIPWHRSGLIDHHPTQQTELVPSHIEIEDVIL